MEDRRTIYYRGNSVIAPHPGLKNRRRRNQMPLKETTLDKELSVTTVEPKVCATSQCVWCDVKFEKYEIRCRVCGNCQYCGRFCPDRRGCRLCGNQLPDELQEPRTKPLVRVF